MKHDVSPHYLVFLVSRAIIAIVGLMAMLFFGVGLIYASDSQHAPIVIQSDSDFTSCACVVSGTGSTANPYIIGPWTINNVNGNAVYVDGTNLSKSFEFLNLTIAGNKTSTDTGIVLNHINPSGTQSIVAKVYGVQTSIQTNNVGILVENSNYITLDGAGANPGGRGVGKSAGVINKNLNGAIDVENSNHITIVGWQLSANGGDNSPNWVTLDPGTWGVGGVRLFGVTYSTIDHVAANNDTDVSYTLFNSNHNTLTNNIGSYPFTMNYLITDGSSYNTLNNNEGSTGDFIGLMLADPLPGTSTLATYGPSHDNVIENNLIHTDGPIGNELSPVDITPSFIGGIIVLNGTYNNTIQNNNTFASFGSDLGWAQAVPNGNTAIGVTTYPPTLHCNVTVSEGGGGVSNLNGNVWKGNTYQTIDPCLPAQ